MKKIIAMIGAVLLSTALLAGCSKDTEPKRDADIESTGAIKTGIDEKVKVVSTIFPGYDFVRAIAGEQVDLTMLLPVGTESHSYEPTPQDIIKIQQSDVFIYIGGETDAWVNEILESMDTSQMEIVSMMDLVEVVEEEIVEGMEHEEEDHAEEGHEELFDEHVWTSPLNAIKIVESLTDTLCKLDEANAKVYQENSAAYVEQIAGVDEELKEVVSKAKRTTLIVADRFPFRYFIEQYGLDYYAAFSGCSTQTDASAQTIAFLIDKTKETEIPVVFHMELSNEKLTDIISESTGAEGLTLHSCHNVTQADFDDGVTYVGLMRRNAENLKKALW